MNRPFDIINHSYSFNATTDRSSWIPKSVVPSMTPTNIYWDIDTGVCYTHEQMLEQKLVPFREVEQSFYKEKFSRYTELTRIPLEKYILDSKSTPLEIILSYDTSVPTETIVATLYNLTELFARTSLTHDGFRRGYILNWALHFDEADLVPHVHIRLVCLGQKHKLIEGAAIPYIMHVVPHNCFASSRHEPTLPITVLTYFRQKILTHLDAIYACIEEGSYVCKLDGMCSHIDEVKVLPTEEEDSKADETVEVSKLRTEETTTQPQDDKVACHSKQDNIEDLLLSVGDDVLNTQHLINQKKRQYIEFKREKALNLLQRFEQYIVAIRGEIKVYDELLNKSKEK